MRALRLILPLATLVACATDTTELQFVDAAPEAAPAPRIVHLAGSGQSAAQARASWGLPDDVLVLENATSSALQDAAVESQLILTGHGQGATTAWAFACERPDLVRAVVMLNGAATDAPCSRGLVSTLVVHGTQDEVISYPEALGAFTRAQQFAQCTDLTPGTTVELGAPTETFACNRFGELGFVTAEHWRVIGWSHNPTLPLSWWTTITDWISLRD